MTGCEMQIKCSLGPPTFSTGTKYTAKAITQTTVVENGDFNKAGIEKH